VVGTDGDDYISVLGGANSVEGGAGNDTIAFLTGRISTIDGSTGVDTLILGHRGTGSWTFNASGPVVTDSRGNQISGFDNYSLGGSYLTDRLKTGAGNDILHGNFGDDTLNGGAGTETLFGDQGNDLSRSTQSYARNLTGR